MKRIFLLVPFVFALSCAGLLTENKENKFKNIEDRMDSIEEKLALIEENMYKTNVRIDNLSENITDLRIEVEKLKMSYIREENLANASTGGGMEEEIVDEEVNYRDIYNKAFKLYTLKKLHQAIDAFNDFIDRFPDSDLTDNAYFWKGRSHFELGELEEAKDIFINLIEKCDRNMLPDCNKAPSAYLMLGRIYEMQGNYEEAESVYEDLKRKYPTSDEAKSLM